MGRPSTDRQPLARFTTSLPLYVKLHYESRGERLQEDCGFYDFPSGLVGIMKTRVWTTMQNLPEVQNLPEDFLDSSLLSRGPFS